MRILLFFFFGFLTASEECSYGPVPKPDAAQMERLRAYLVAADESAQSVPPVSKDTFLVLKFTALAPFDARHMVRGQAYNWAVWNQNIQSKGRNVNELHARLHELHSQNPSPQCLIGINNLDAGVIALNHLNIWFLQMLCDRIDFQKGYGSYFIVNGCEHHMPSPNPALPPLQVSFYVQGPWSLTLNIMPTLLIDVRPVVTNPFDFFRGSSWMRVNSGKPTQFIVTSEGITKNPVLLVSRSESELKIELVEGARSQMPFFVIREATISSEDPNFVNFNFINAGQQCFPLPETDADLSVIDLLLAQVEGMQKKREKLAESRVEEVEEEDDGVVDGAAAAVEHRKVKLTREEKQKLREEEQKRRKEQEELDRQAHIQRLEDKALREIIAEIEGREAYEQQVKREQEAVRRRVMRDAGRPEEPRKRSKAFSQGNAAAASAAAAQSAASEVGEEPEDVRRARVRALAEKELSGRRTKMFNLVKCLNSLFKVIPEARDRMLRHNGGSHMVLDGASAAVGPATLVRPHGGGDGTLSTRRVLSFIDALFCCFGRT